MKNRFIFLLLLPALLIFISCNKEKSAEAYDDSDLIKSTVLEEADLLLGGGGDFERVITKRLVRPDDCRFITAGTIEFRKDGVAVAVIDFGNGRCDQWASKTVDGKTTRFSLKRFKAKGDYYRVVTEPIVKLEDCDYIVSGVVELYSLKDDSWLATIDFGDGTCDEWATKTWDGGSKEFSMEKWN